jgi:hypothetical protein
MDRIELQQVGGRGCVTAAVIDMDDGDPRPAPKGAKDKPADAAEAIDADVHRHRQPGTKTNQLYLIYRVFPGT